MPPQFSERAGAKFLSAKTDLAWAAMLIERDAPGDAQRARDLLGAAHTVAAANGYARLQRQGRRRAPTAGLKGRQRVRAVAEHTRRRVR